MNATTGKLALIPWQDFVIQHGFRANVRDLSAVLNQPCGDIEELRRTGACTKLPKAKGFEELFSLRHGRLPEDHEWRLPRKSVGGKYEWLTQEVVLLASLVGLFSPETISKTLTERLRKITGDQSAERSKNSVVIKLNTIGLMTTDLLGGITAAQAGREISSVPSVYQAIEKKQLRANKVGRLLVISHKDWEEWKSKRVFPPKGYVLLASLKEPLSIKSDKLSEFARMGYVPTAVRCNPYGTKGPSTQFGTWFIDEVVAKQLIDDRRGGRPMPWQGKSNPDNIRVTFRLWEKRKHPATCDTCKTIWGKQGAPKNFEAYLLAYPPLAHGAKRHLTRKWCPGLTVQEVAEQSGQSPAQVRRAIKNGMLAASGTGRLVAITRTDATRWVTRKCPSGDSKDSWISLQKATEQYLFTMNELKNYIENGQLHTKNGANASNSEKDTPILVSRHQCGHLREKIGFTAEDAANRLGLTVEQLRILIHGVDWRKSTLIPLVTIQAVIKRLNSKSGLTITEAADKLGVDEKWVKARIDDGTIKVIATKWAPDRLYITRPMFKRLEKFIVEPETRTQKLDADWLSISDAAIEAGVSNITVTRWASAGEITRTSSTQGWRYHRGPLRARTREFWKNTRLKRALPPKWLQEELHSGQA